MTAAALAVTPDEDEAAPPVSLRIRALAREAYEAASGNWLEAIRFFEERLGADPVMYREFAAPLIRQAGWALIRSMAGDERDRIAKSAGITEPRYGNESLKRQAERRKAALMDWPLDGGVRLADATRALVETVAERYLKCGRADLVNGFWLDGIAKAMPQRRPDATVGATLTEEKLATMRERATQKVSEKF